MKILEFLTNFIPLEGNVVVNLILTSILLVLSASVAYCIGGMLGYSGKKVGFILWLVTALLIYALFAFILNCIMWFLSLPWWVYVIILIVLLAIITITILIIRKKNKEKQNETRNKK